MGWGGRARPRKLQPPAPSAVGRPAPAPNRLGDYSCRPERDVSEAAARAAVDVSRVGNAARVKLRHQSSLKMSGMLNTTLSGLNSDSYCEIGDYRDQYFLGKQDQWEKALKKSCTLYVGNLSFYTTEEQIHELFSKCGDVKRIIMGLDKVKKTPCGFCFVEYYTRAESEHCMRFINGTRLDDRMIRIDWDTGFKEGRQYGRGKTGGQVRDEYRTDYDVGRGGFGKTIQKQKMNQQSVIY